MPEFPPAPPRFRILFLLLHLFASLAVLLMLLQQVRPVELPDLKLEEGERFNCLSYAPYHRPGQTPLDPATYISREQIAADLAALVPLTRCVRTYAVNQGLEQVPAVARELGLQVLLGAWVGHEAAHNRRELETALDLANRYPDVVRGLILGNEVLLRREQSEQALKALLEEARSRSRIPVTYADVWEFWLRHPGLADSVDFLTIHILPYWEDEPVAVEAAIAHVARIHERMQQRCGKPILIGETGWPSRGRQREAARPGRVEQARYIRSFVQEAHARGWDYNLIEAIDQPWKRRLEGTVGGYWGILDDQLQTRFPLQGPVSERQGLGLPLLAALFGCLACLGLALGRGSRQCPAGRAGAAAAGAWLGFALCLVWEHGMAAYRSPWEWGILGGVALLGTVLTLSPVWATIGRISWHAAWQTRNWRACLQPGIRLALLFAAATAAILLLADPRYRDFPLWLYLLPLPALLAQSVSRMEEGREEGILAVVVMACGLARWLQEPGNPEAQAWAGLCLLLGTPILASISRARRAAGAEVSKQ